MKASEPVLITVEEMAARLSIGKTAAWDLVHKHKIKSIKIGKSRRVPITSLQEYIERLLEEGAA